MRRDTIYHRSVPQKKILKDIWKKKQKKTPDCSFISEQYFTKWTFYIVSIALKVKSMLVSVLAKYDYLKVWRL